MSINITRHDQLCAIQKAVRDQEASSDTALMLGFYCAEIKGYCGGGFRKAGGTWTDRPCLVATTNPNTDLGGITTWCYVNQVPFKIVSQDESSTTIEVEL